MLSIASSRAFIESLKDHPEDLHLALYVAKELSTYVRIQLEDHLVACHPCNERLFEMGKRLEGASSQEEALAIAQGEVGERDAFKAVLENIASWPQFHEGNGGCHGPCPVCAAKGAIANAKNKKYLRMEVYMKGWDDGYEEGIKRGQEIEQNLRKEKP